MSTLESNKTFAIIGSILLMLSVVPYAGAVLGIIGVVLLLMAMKGFANYYQDDTIYQNALSGLIYYVIAIIALAVAMVGLVLSLSTIYLLGLGVIFGIIALIAAFVFFLFAAKRLRAMLTTLADKTGEHAFLTAGTLLWIGSILIIVFGLGSILIFVAWIFVIIGFFSMKTPSQPYNQPKYGYTPPPPPQPSQPAQGTMYCPNCGSPVNAGATFCQHCGKPIA